jgi:hypothetical protein
VWRKKGKVSFIINPKGTAEGWGYPAISNANFQKVDALLKSSGGKVLMWMYGDE